MGTSETMLRIDGEYFQYKTLEKWQGRADFIVFHYHAFNLYIALLLDVRPVAQDAIRNCHAFSEGAKGSMNFFFPL